MSRILIVSNRLPITVVCEGDDVQVERSTGGLATGLKATHESSKGLWIGWPGFSGELNEKARAELDMRYRELGVLPVQLSETEVLRYYEGYCNGVLWPLFHGFLGKLPLDVPDWPIYEAINERFAEAVAAHYQTGDLVWVQDYQLMLVPRMVRQRLPAARIGFFLHVPFPSPEIFRTLSAREQLLDGILSADLVGFHTAAYMRNFASSVLHILGVSTDVDRLRWQGRASSLGVFPLGVDAKAIEAKVNSYEVSQLLSEFRASPQEQLLVGIDRLDYTKGIPRRLLAYERLLEQHPELHGRVRLVQVAVPSRINVDAYAGFRNQVDALVGRINGRFGSPQWAPVHYVYRGLSEYSVVALFRAADVLLVTPIKDGMNLVAKEFCAARSDEGGVLVLSEFAGASAELAEALHINPYDIENTASTLHRALTLTREECRTRMVAMRQRVYGYDVYRWASAFVSALEDASQRPDNLALKMSTTGELDAAVQAMLRASRLLVLLDYDGTLMPIVAIPNLARPDDALLKLLHKLAKHPGLDVHIISGRNRDTLSFWLGQLAIGLHAEHGFWSRWPGEEWEGREILSDAWRPRALDILRDFTERTPGSLIEEKQSGIAWHYRMCDPEFGAVQANELKVHLSALLTNAPVELLSGDKVVELRPHGSNKGHVAQLLTEQMQSNTVVVAFGDDVTDEDMFAALPDNALSFHLGSSSSRAKFRIKSWKDVRRILMRLVN